jgi:NADPH:quinone reductase-like Zn-dependent oxidoreductase
MSTHQNRAAWLTEAKARPLTISEAPMPTPQNDEVVIKVHAAAVNPADWAIQAMGILVKPENYPYILGCDIAGVVTSVGPKNTRFREGDRVTATCLSFLTLDSRNSGFQEYVVGMEPLVAKLPDAVGFTEGSVLPIALCTAAYSLFMKDCLALDYPRAGIKPNEKGKLLLVWGGGSSVGACAIQLAKAAGYTVAATSSSKNFGLMKDIGVDLVFDYKSEGVVDEIVESLKGKGEQLAGVFDSILAEDTIRSCAEIANRLEGRKHVGTVLAPGMPFPKGLPEGVDLSVTNCTAIRDNEVGQRIWADWLAGALADGSMKCKPDPEVVGKGLEKMQDALDAMGKGVSARKIVVEL